MEGGLELCQVKAGSEEDGGGVESGGESRHERDRGGVERGGVSRHERDRGGVERGGVSSWAHYSPSTNQFTLPTAQYNTSAFKYARNISNSQMRT